MMQIDRRQFMKWSGVAALTVAGTSILPLSRISTAFAAAVNPSFEPDVDIHLEATPGTSDILPGASTNVWSFQGRVLVGPDEALDLSGNSYLGPTFRLKRGQKVRIRFVNQLPEPTIVHWHGLHVPATMDGHPRFAVAPGGSYTYEFEVLNQAGTYWYHPHPHGLTGHQVYGGMAGLFIVSDDREAALGLPGGGLDIPMVIQDRLFDRANQLVYLPAGMMDRMSGMMGDTILVNGHIDSTLDVETRAYRLRILNGSNARIYRLAWEDGMPLTVIGTDGGLLSRPIPKSEVLLGPGERIEVWADFSTYPTGAQIRLISLPVPFNAIGGGMMGGMMGRRRRSDDAPITIQRFHVTRRSVEINKLPKSLVPMDRYSAKDAQNASTPRRFQLAMDRMQGTINGRVFEMEGVARDETVELGALEVWEFSNNSSGMGMMNMALPHPMHIHGGQFQVLGRSGADNRGYVDEGWKDTVLVQPGERVQVLIRFGPFKGMYLYHCHNLEHEDSGMMRNFVIA